jgi:hypothetical protein
VLISGATGFLGRQLALRLARDGHQVVALARNPAEARHALGDEVRIEPEGASASGLRALVGRVDAVLNLAGAPILGPRWTVARRRELARSRIGTTGRLAAAIAAARRRPGVFVCGSAVGIYGERADFELPEDVAPGSGFLAELCRDWEAAARPALDAGVRCVHLRTGVVLGPGGGALAAMEPAFALGLGGRLGSGQQWTPWIHVRDWIEMAVAALFDERWSGPINAVAPQPATNAAFTRTLAAAMHRPVLAPPAPAAALRALLGGAADVLLASQRAVPARALALGFGFRYGSLADALEQIYGARRLVQIAPVRREFGTPVAQHELRTESVLPAPLERVFAFFSAPANLGAITPPAMGFQHLGDDAVELREGVELDHTVRVGPLRLLWRSRIDAWEPGRRFVDTQLRGPYRLWWHEHVFERAGAATRMVDRVRYSLPMAWIAPLVHALFVRRQLQAIFAYRAHAVALRFGDELGHGER